MAYWYSPTNYSLADLFNTKKGDTGDRVAALQLNLRGIATDGVFGDLTEERVKTWQENHNLLVDGQPGQKTQESIVRSRSKNAAQTHGVPQGLLPSVALHESAFALAAYSKHPSDWGYDLGPYQNSIGPRGDLATQTSFQQSYDAEIMANRAASQAKDYHDRLILGAAMDDASFYAAKLEPLDHYDKNVWAWQLGVLSWNWPAAATNLSKYGNIYQDASRDDQFQQWIWDASDGRLSTPREWVLAYVDSATRGIKWIS